VWHLLVEGEILGLEAALSQNVFHGNAPALLPKPSLNPVKAAAVLLGHGFIIGWRRSQGASDGIEQRELQEANRGSDL